MVAAALLAAGACSDQAEGQRCDTFNGDADCASGLVCTKAAQLGSAGSDDKWAVCCPPVGVPPTAAACQPKFPGFETPDAGSTPKRDASTPAKPDAAIADAAKSG